MYPVPTTADAQSYAAHIAAEWRKSLDGILRMGQLLAEAKEQLPHGEFGRMFHDHENPVADPLPFGARSAQMLMRIAATDHLANPKYISSLPSSWGTLNYLARLEPDDFAGLVDEGEITPAMKQSDAYKLWRTTKRRELHAAAANLPPNTSQSTFDGQTWKHYRKSEEARRNPVGLLHGCISDAEQRIGWMEDRYQHARLGIYHYLSDPDPEKEPGLAWIAEENQLRRAALAERYPEVLADLEKLREIHDRALARMGQLVADERRELRKAIKVMKGHLERIEADRPPDPPPILIEESDTPGNIGGLPWRNPGLGLT